MDNRLAELIIAAAATIVAVAWAASAGAQVAEAFAVPLEALVNRDAPPYSEMDFRLGDHRQLKGRFLDRGTALGERNYGAPRQGSYAIPPLQKQRQEYGARGPLSPMSVQVSQSG